MENLLEYRLENPEMIYGGELWETGCDENGKHTDYWDDELERTVYL